MTSTTPIIETSRLNLEPFDINKHLTDRYVSWLNDPNVVRYSEQRHHHHTTDSCRAFAQRFTNSPNHFWAIIAKTPTQIHIGNLVAYIDIPNRIAEMSILIGESLVRGQGLGTEAWNIGLQYLLTDAQMRKIYAGTMSENIAMLKVFSRSGMLIECRQPRHFLFEGREIDLIIASIFPNCRFSIGCSSEIGVNDGSQSLSITP